MRVMAQFEKKKTTKKQNDIDTPYIIIESLRE